ncbi:MAG: M28 family peptidase [Cyclobacteriaceae bacterium]
MKFKISLSVLILVLVNLHPDPSLGQSPEAKILSENIDKHIRLLASDDFLGRRPGTAGEEKTTQYLMSQLEEMGVEPANNGSYKQEFAISQLYHQPTGNMIIHDTEGDVAFEFGKDFYAKTTMPDKEVSIKEAEMVFAGFGIVAPEYEWDDYEEIDVRGKIVLVMFSDPGFYRGEADFFNGMQPSRYADFNYKKSEAMARGARGVLMIFNSIMNWDAIGSRSTSGPLFLKEQPDLVSDGLQISGIVSIRLMKHLLEASGLDHDYEQDALSENFKPLEFKTRLSLDVRADTKEVINTSNIIGMIKGSGRPDECIVYTAHWDHVGTRPASFGTDSIFNGAVDNASGTSMVLEIARAFSQLKRKPDRTVIFFFTSAEEMGLLGAEYYTSNPIIPLNKTVCVINADSNYPTTRMKTVVNVLDGLTELDKFNHKAAKKLGRRIIPDDSPPEMNVFRRGDHYPFVRKGGVPATWMVGAMDPLNGDSASEKVVADYMQHYHQVTDEYYDGFIVDNIVFDAQLDFLIGLKLANNKAWPGWSNDSGYKKLRDQHLSNN